MGVFKLWMVSSIIMLVDWLIGIISLISRLRFDRVIGESVDDTRMDLVICGFVCVMVIFFSLLIFVWIGGFVCAAEEEFCVCLRVVRISLLTLFWEVESGNADG